MANGIHISKYKYVGCNYCNDEEKPVLEIESEASCYEYGDCGCTIEICVDCLSKILNGKLIMVSGKLKAPVK